MSVATGAGLFVALVVPFLTYGVAEILYGGAQLSASIAVGLVVHWIHFAVLIAIVLLAEHQPLASIGLKALRWGTVPAGLLAGVAITLLSNALVRALGLSVDTQVVSYLQSLPFVTRLLLVVTAGVFEETLFRGYAIERLTAISGSQWLAGLVTVTLFTLAHAPAFGFAHLPPICIVSVFITLLYLWRRDLVLNMIAHATIDGIGLLLAPILQQSAR